MIFCSPRFGVVFMLSDANLEIITFEKICFCVFILLFVICRLALVQLVYCASVCFKRIFHLSECTVLSVGDCALCPSTSNLLAFFKDCQ